MENPEYNYLVLFFFIVYSVGETVQWGYPDASISNLKKVWICFDKIHRFKKLYKKVIGDGA